MRRRSFPFRDCEQSPYAPRTVEDATSSEMRLGRYELVKILTISEDLRAHVQHHDKL